MGIVSDFIVGRRGNRGSSPPVSAPLQASFSQNSGTTPGAGSPYRSPDRLKDGQFYVKDDAIVMQKRLSGGDHIILAPAHIPIFLPDDISEAEKESERKRRSADDRSKREDLTRLKMLIQMRDLTKEILDLQERYSDADVAVMGKTPWDFRQKELKALYGAFIPTYGPINRFEIRKSGRHDGDGERGEYRVYPNLKKFRKDADARRVAALVETYDDITGAVAPGPIFSPRMVQARGESIDVRTPREALGLCLSEKATVDFAYIARVLGGSVNETDIQKQLSEEGHVFFDPASGLWEISEVYLSGNVRQKLREAEAAASTHKNLGRNVKALKEILPRDLTPGQIEATLGVHWIPAGIIEEFAATELGIADPKVFYYPRTHSWFVQGKKEKDPDRTNGFSTEYFSSLRLLQHALADTQPGLTHHLGADGVTVDRELETEKAKEQVEALRAHFKQWLWADPARSERLCTLYNERFNAVVPRKYDGSHMRFPGAAVDLKPRAHQKDMVWRSWQGGNALVGHPVGAGKTYTSIWSAVTMAKKGRKDGAAGKPLFVVPNNILGQFSRAFIHAYPNGDPLVLEDDMLEESDPSLTMGGKIEKFISRARDHDWDAVFMTQSAFDRLSVSPQTRLQKALDELRDIEEMIASFGDETALPQTLRNHMESDRNKGRMRVLEVLGLGGYDRQDVALTWETGGFEILKTKEADGEDWKPHLEKLPNHGKRSFEDAGFTFIYMDEGHGNKNREIESRIDGMAKEGSGRSKNLDEKLYHLRKVSPQAQLTLMTATFISNTISEMYTYQCYLQPERLRQHGIYCFDAWAAMFANARRSVEVTPEGGTYREVVRLAEYKNLPELRRMVGQFLDYVDEKDLGISKPRLKGDKPEIVHIPESRQLKAFFQTLLRRGKAIRAGGVPPQVDNMLKLVMEGCLATLHPVLAKLKPDPGEKTKIDYAAENAARLYFEQRDRVYLNDDGTPSPATGSTQLIFSDLGVPKGAGEYSVYEDLRKTLIQKGVPAQTIAFVHDYPLHRKEEFLAKVRAGEIAIAIGSTEMLGTGSNLQNRCAAIHHLDVPWRPMDYIQRNGRVERQGNQNAEYEAFYYLMEGSLDEYRLQTVQRKAWFIGQFISGYLENLRHFKEEDTLEALYAHMVETIAPPDEEKIFEGGFTPDQPRGPGFDPGMP